jgi:hypothetical protein
MRIALVEHGHTMSSSESEIREELETLGKAVRTFARFEIQALAWKLIYQLQRFQRRVAEGIEGTTEIS